MLAAQDAETVLPPTSRGRWLVLVILGLAFALRVGAVLADDGYRPLNDSSHFDRLATSMTEGDGFRPALFDLPGPSAYRAPLYPASLAAVYAVVGDHSYTAGRIVNGLIGTGLVALIGITAAQLWGRRAGGVALVIAAAHPTLILHGTSLMSEPLLATLIVAATAAALQHHRQPNGLRWAIAAGALVGLAALTRETGFLLLPGVALLLLWAGENHRRSVLAPALAIVAAAAVVAPWTLRNAVQLEAFVPVSTSGGYSFAGTFNQTAMDNPRDPAIWIPPQVDPAMAASMLAIEEPNEVELDSVLRDEAAQFARENPGYIPKVLFWNTVRFFDLQGPRSALEYSQYVPYTRDLTRVAVYASWVVGLLAIAGLVRGATRRPPLAIWIFPLLAFALHIILSANIRYRATLEPFTVLLAAFAVTQIVTNQVARRQQP